MNHTNTDEIICPYCSYPNDETEALKDMTNVIECIDCEKNFSYTSKTIYTTSKID